MLLTLVFGSCMSVAAESIAGEKERGTIATMLATPVNRKDIARGKVFACSLIGLAIALSSIIGIFGSLPSILQGEFDASRYGAQEYALIALVVTSLTVLIVTAITIISTFAKSTKEAQTFLLPAMIVVMGIGVIGMLSGSVQKGLLYYIIPVYGSVESLIGILSFDYQLSSLIACFISNCAFSTIGVIVLERLFKSENLMFAK
jgi:sodium transport system permease protein